VSEGRDHAVIEQIAKSITHCRILDIHSDPDHHRSVFTLVGDDEQIAEGAIALTKSAIALLDLRTHRGVHPRMGAVDVIPFIPLGQTPMSACVAVAERVGQTIGEDLGVPVFLYGAAARSSACSSLPSVRRGGFENLKAKLTEMPPDFGPREPHPTAGAVAVGARPLLVAYNVVLASDDLSIAKQIAATLRESNGGLPGLRALGMMLVSRQRVQVSMNLTDIHATTIPAAFRAVQREAQRLGVGVLESEIVGLIPEIALDGATASNLLLPYDPCERILETRIKRQAL
jgi:glutamate formiminotransferase